ncbi:transcriptional corepressor SEUSS-like isoform X2 [Durio zibethinus]|uniref:Transcriptional corepressor SEUSS-like isoform X2 n=1 Tax=Durio zibethinus TaxID=66656 RepID=A0A6P6BC88_DURZI|nr:transcriptional corepressor SEUSS-like isoform X2 [Durio zibethinus]
MVPSGPPTPIGGAPSVSPALMRTNSSILGSQGGSMPQQATFSSIVSPRAQYNMNLLGSTANISSLLNQTFGNGGLNSGLAGVSGFQHRGFDTTAESDPLTAVANEIGFNAPSSSFTPSNVANSGSSGQLQNQQISNSAGNPVLSDQQQSQVQQSEPQKFRHGQLSMQQFPLSHSQSQQQFQSIRGGIGGAGAVKLEPQTMNDQVGPQQQLQSFRNLGPVKLEPQQNQIGRGIGPVKLERQQSDQAMLLQQQQQQQQQQQFLQLSRQSSQTALAHMNLLQQQRILQMQHQQQLLKSLPQQRPQLQPQFQQQNLPIRSAVRPAYEPGTCARRLTQYIYQQQHRPDDNNIEFWRKFVAEFFATNAKKRWCVSLYGNSRQTNGVFPQDIWHCEICNCKPGRGFETTVEVLPRLFKIKYDSGTLEELLYVDMPREYHNANGQIVLDYAKAIQESVFEHLRVVRDGQLRIVFSPDLKICSWEFCARRHEELIPRRLIISQVSQLGAAAQKYQASAQNASSNLSALDLQSNCNMFVASARQLAKALDVPLVNDLGYTKRYVRCLQISEVVNSMKDLIDYSRETGMGPMESLAKFPRRSSPSSARHNSAQQTQGQQQVTGENANNDPHSIQSTVLQPSSSNGVASVNNSQDAASTFTSASTIVGLLRQNSMNSRIENQMNNPNSPYAGTPVQIPSAGSSTSLPPTQPNPSSPFSSLTPSSSNLPLQSSHNAMASSTTAKNVNSANSSAQIPPQLSSQSSEVDPNESQSSVEKIIQEIMISSQFSEAGSSVVSVGSVGSNLKNNNGFPQVSGSCLMGNRFINNNSGTGGGGFGNLSDSMGLSPNPTAMRSAMGNNFMNFTGRVSMPLMPQEAVTHQQQELAYRLLSGLGADGFNNLEFDWKSP